MVTVATVNTGHFEFMAVGTNEEEARAALLGGWWRHTREYRGAEVDLINQLLRDGEVRFTTMPMGGAARDGEPL